MAKRYQRKPTSAALAEDAFARACLKLNHDAVINALHPDAPIVMAIDNERLNTRPGIIFNIEGHIHHVDSAASLDENVSRLKAFGAAHAVRSVTRSRAGRFFHEVINANNGAAILTAYAIRLACQRILKQRDVLRENDITVRQALVAEVDRVASFFEPNIPGITKEVTGLLAARLKTRRNRLVKRKTHVPQLKTSDLDASFIEEEFEGSALRYVEDIDRALRSAA